MFVIAIILFGRPLIGCVGGPIFWFVAMYHFVAMIRNKSSRQIMVSRVYDGVHSICVDRCGKNASQARFLFLGGFFGFLAVAGDP
jgi:hypothetical protein